MTRILRNFVIPAIDGSPLIIYEQPMPNRVCLEIDNHFCWLTPEAFRAMCDLGETYRSSGDYVRFVSPEPPVAEHSVEPPTS